MCLRGRAGRKERQAKAQLVTALHPTLGRIIQVTGHRWKHTFTATSTDRQADKQAHPRAGQQHSGGTDWLLPASSWGYPHLPRTPQPGQTMSRGGCGEPTGLAPPPRPETSGSWVGWDTSCRSPHLLPRERTPPRCWRTEWGRISLTSDQAPGSSQPGQTRDPRPDLYSAIVF